MDGTNGGEGYKGLRFKIDDLFTNISAASSDHITKMYFFHSQPFLMYRGHNGLKAFVIAPGPGTIQVSIPDLPTTMHSTPTPLVKVETQYLKQLTLRPSEVNTPRLAVLPIEKEHPVTAGCFSSVLYRLCLHQQSNPLHSSTAPASTLMHSHPHPGTCIHQHIFSCSSLYRWLRTDLLYQPPRNHPVLKSSS